MAIPETANHCSADPHTDSMLDTVSNMQGTPEHQIHEVNTGESSIYSLGYKGKQNIPDS